MTRTKLGNPDLYEPKHPLGHAVAEPFQAPRRALKDPGCVATYRRFLRHIALSVAVGDALPMTPEDAVDAIENAYAARGIAIPGASVLRFLLDETRRFTRAMADLAPRGNDAQTDEAAISVGGRLLEAVRLGDALGIHAAHRTPKITETLETLAAFERGNEEHEDQFHEAEYELHAASQFVTCGQRVAFVDTARPSRYRQRVEFMLGTKWPVECKRPRSPARIIDNVRAAAAKITERAQPGIVCVALEEALPHQLFFREAFTVQDVREAVSREFNTWWGQNGRTVLDALQGSSARFAILNYTALSYEHATEEVGLPSLRLAVAQDGEWIERDVCCECVRRLAKERAIMTGQWVE